EKKDMDEMYSDWVAKRALKTKAIKLNPDNPFQWASGYRMPIYNDNRMLLSSYMSRKDVVEGFVKLIEESVVNRDIVIAGTSTAGIPWAAGVANFRCNPMIYIRDKPKDHGLRNQIEGIDAESDLEGKTAVVIEDLISTGGSSVAAVQAVRDAKGNCNHCFSIFSYGFKEALEMFEGKRPYDKEKTKFLTTPCEVKSILTYDKLLQVAKDTGYLNAEQVKLLEDWRADPWNWGANHGFPKVEKK
ncbi:MAG: orotate phosphoribosyltransferase, partial [archaeon]|nr:orotate phosphoribosyltransferase [archaeon]